VVYFSIEMWLPFYLIYTFEFLGLKNNPLLVK
jgi:hypothetical protein